MFVQSVETVEYVSPLGTNIGTCLPLCFVPGVKSPVQFRQRLIACCSRSE